MNDPKPDESPAKAKFPADLLAARETWLQGIGKVDARTMALLRAAFEAGAEAAMVFKAR